LGIGEKHRSVNALIIIAGRKPRTFSAGMNDRKAISSFCGRGGNQEAGILPAHES